MTDAEHGLADEVARLRAELAAERQARDTTAHALAEAHAQQTATAELVRLVSHAPDQGTDQLNVVLQTVAETAARLCHADFASVFLRDADDLVVSPSAPVAGVALADAQALGQRGSWHTVFGPAGEAIRTGRRHSRPQRPSPRPLSRQGLRTTR